MRLPSREVIPRVSSETHAPRKYFPWTKRPSTEECADNLPTPNVDITRPQRGHVVPSTQRVGRDVRAQRPQSKRKRCKESGGAIVPVVDELQRVPENLTVKDDACACHSNTDKAG
jgi:hypothetical protein